ncbi:FAD-binding protein [Phenylobacterium aquaticum]|uniref:FAD-binding protein n=1 Tax=Phenylobacterium aquaticum TaxID=1763816 RepID=UPI001F5CE6AB|nr:FAD-binding protein [Phenylobacterium aquaticum]MCI3135625.1 FAD-binding protein [Phenylobacterium aquaticum]
MTEKVLVIGSGMAGLFAALALAPSGRELVILERDPAPPAGDPDQAFADWARRGVGHLRHSHAFLARLRSVIRDEHRPLLDDLLAAGCREITFAEMLTDLHKPRYVAQPVDADMVVLTSRRTTLELIIRRYVERLPHVTIRSETFVKSLAVETEPNRPLKVTGVVLESGETLTADLVVDAAGRTSDACEQLTALGAAVGEVSETAGILYFTRHYRLRPGQAEPPRGKSPASGDLGFMKFGVFPADNGCFSITICVPEIEMEMRKAIVDPATFDALCRQIPGMEPWIDPERSEGVSRVFGMGDLHSRWRDLVKDGRPAATGFFAIGDSLVRTNPLYGRGCSFAAVSAYALRDTLNETADAVARALLFHDKIQAEIRPYYDNMLEQDRAAIRRARHALTPGYRPNLRAKVLKSFLEDGVNIAVRSDPGLMREALRSFHMLEHPSAWLRRPRNIAKVVGYWARGKSANAAAYPPKLGPERDELYTALGVSPRADIERLAAERA